MDKDTGVETTEQVEKAASGVVEWVIYAVIIAVAFGAFFWVFLYSSYFAELSFVIPVRNFYQDAYWKIGGTILGKNSYPPFNPIYIIQPQKPIVAGTNTYTLIGTFEKIDAEKALVYIKGTDQKTYIFRAEYAMLFDNDQWLMTVEASSVQNLSSIDVSQLTLAGPRTSANLVKQVLPDSSSQPVSPPPATTIPTTSEIKFRQVLIRNNTLSSPLNIVGVRWNDIRTFSQIENDYKKNPTIPLDQGSPESFVLAVFQ